MKKTMATIMAVIAIAMTGCGTNHVPAPSLESEGTENIIVENIIIEETIIDEIKLEEIERVEAERTSGVALNIGYSLYDTVESVKIYLKNGGEITEPKEQFCARFNLLDVLWEELNGGNLWCEIGEGIYRNFRSLGQ